jgi:hypothetical protein
MSNHISEEELAAEREKRREKYAPLMERVRARRDVVDAEKVAEAAKALRKRKERGTP